MAETACGPKTAVRSVSGVSTESSFESPDSKISKIVWPLKSTSELAERRWSTRTSLKPLTGPQGVIRLEC